MVNSQILILRYSARDSRLQVAGSASAWCSQHWAVLMYPEILLVKYHCKLLVMNLLAKPVRTLDVKSSERRISMPDWKARYLPAAVLKRHRLFCLASVIFMSNLLRNFRVRLTNKRRGNAKSVSRSNLRTRIAFCSAPVHRRWRFWYLYRQIISFVHVLPAGVIISSMVVNCTVPALLTWRPRRGSLRRS